MRSLVIVACLIAMAAAACGPLERMKIKNHWSQVFSSEEDRKDFSRDFWREFFGVAPSARALFSRVNGENIFSPEFQAHGLRVLGGLDMTIALLHENDILDAELAHLQYKHTDIAISDEHWTLFKQALALVVDRRANVGQFDLESWSDCADVIGAGIRQ